MQKVREVAGKKVVVIGLARQGVALVRHLAARGARVTVSDLKPADALRQEIARLAGLPVEYRLGGHPLDMLEEVDLLCLSGGVPLDLPIVEEARRKGIPLTNDTQLFLEATPARVVGITGSSGKTTTTALVGRMAQTAAKAGGLRRFWVGGNIGNPLLGDLEKMDARDLAVLELSSFQLELAAASPQVAAILNLTPNHLDRHRTMEAYREAKARILAFQTTEDSAILGWDSPETRNLANRVRGRLVFFGVGPKAWKGDGAFRDGDRIVTEREGKTETVLPAAQIRLRGEHNLANVIAACAIGMSAGFTGAAMAVAVREFRGVPHRLELIASRCGADWYDDSIATTPERAMAAIRSFREPIILLAGGREKKLPWGAWADLVRRRVDHLVLFGEAADLIGRAVGGGKDGGRPYSIDRVGSLEEAVVAAAQRAQAGDVVLLSPGGTSYDAFRDFEERGQRFRALVQALEEGKRNA